MRGFVLFVLAGIAGTIAAYGVLSHGPIPSLTLAPQALAENQRLNSVESVLASRLSPKATKDQTFKSAAGGEEVSPLNAPRSPEKTTRSFGSSTARNPADAPESLRSKNQKATDSSAEKGGSSLRDGIEETEEQTASVSSSIEADTASRGTELKDLPFSIKSIDLDRFGSIQGQECRVGLKEIGFRSLSVRKGSFQHGDVLDWESEYGKNSRISTLYAKRDPVVKVLALATNKDGGLEAALVQEKSSKKTGVIALFVEGKNVPLDPVK